ncbi:hypothetical protein [Cupriavidus pauculus]|uniref:hypothetical protein n=1 Tax=Cupriavidus pauculus TaxID=82633 RepID=UPI0007808B20|nr:hypothetical protein [Cupriavidus pauculus]
MNEEFEKWAIESKRAYRDAQYGLVFFDPGAGPRYREAWQASRKQALDAAIAECEKLTTLAEEDAALENDERFLVYAKKYRRCSEAIRALQKE